MRAAAPSLSLLFLFLLSFLVLLCCNEASASLAPNWPQVGGNSQHSLVSPFNVSSAAASASSSLPVPLQAVTVSINTGGTTAPLISSASTNLIYSVFCNNSAQFITILAWNISALVWNQSVSLQGSCVNPQPSPALSPVLPVLYVQVGSVLYQFNANTGDILSTVALGATLATLTVSDVDGSVYGVGNGFLYKVSNGATPWHSSIWNPDSPFAVVSIPVLSLNESVVMVVCSGGGIDGSAVVLGFDSTTGNPKWMTSLPSNQSYISAPTNAAPLVTNTSSSFNSGCRTGQECLYYPLYPYGILVVDVYTGSALSLGSYANEFAALGTAPVLWPSSMSNNPFQGNQSLLLYIERVGDREDPDPSYSLSVAELSAGQAVIINSWHRMDPDLGCDGEFDFINLPNQGSPLLTNNGLLLLTLSDGISQGCFVVVDPLTNTIIYQYMQQQGTLLSAGPPLVLEDGRMVLVDQGMQQLIILQVPEIVSPGGSSSSSAGGTGGLSASSGGVVVSASSSSSLAPVLLSSGFSSSVAEFQMSSSTGTASSDNIAGSSSKMLIVLSTSIGGGVLLLLLIAGVLYRFPQYRCWGRREKAEGTSLLGSTDYPML